MNNLNLSLRPLASALAVSLFTVALPLAAHAETISYSFGSTVSDTTSGPGSTSIELTGSSNITQFDANTGVLMGASMQVNSTATQTIAAQGTNASLGRNSSLVTLDGRGSAGNFSFSAAGVNSNFGGFSTTAVNTSCSVTTAGSSCTAPTVTDAGAAVNSGALTVGGLNLNNYVGTSTVTGSYSAQLSANATTTGGNFSSLSATYGLTWAGNLQVTYDYLLHAAGSFGSGASQLSLDLDFGTLVLGDAASLGFDIFNLLGDRVGLDLDSIAFASGDAGKFNISSCAFTALAAGSSSHCLAGLDTSTLGSFSGVFNINLSDENVGASSSRKDQILTLNLRGIVGAPTNVPEPASLALLGAGLAGLGFARRKRS